jgi:hypothetical protein
MFRTNFACRRPAVAIKAGYMIGIGQENAEIGRKFTNRPMPY